MFVLQLLEKNGRTSEPMIFQDFGVIQASVRLTWSRSEFKGEILPKGDRWELFEISPLGIRAFIGIIKKTAHADGYIHKEATHL